MSGRCGGVRTVSKSDGFLVLYPVYFDSRFTRGQGRRVPAAQAAVAPEAKDVFEAAKAARLEPILEDEHPHPSTWFERSGRVLIPRSSAASKRAAIQAVGKEIRRVVAARPEGRHERPHPHRRKGKHRGRR